MKNLKLILTISASLVFGINLSFAQKIQVGKIVKDNSVDHANNKVDNTSNKALDKVDQGVTNMFKKKDKTTDTTKTTATNTKKETKAKDSPSDVDVDVPTTRDKNDFRFALIIGNEDYSSFQPDLKSESNVDFASSDAKSFKEYMVKTLGTPEENITMYTNATAAQMKQGLAKMNLLAKSSNGKAEIFMYYAGHGLPDEVTKEPYMIPVDVNGSNLEQAVKLADAYAKLTEFPSAKVTVFLDACFSGGARNQALQSARAVKINPKVVTPQNKFVVFAASTGDQTSMPYKDKKHGLFTYYLLKKLQETKGDVTYKDLATYIQDNVALQSVKVNNKEQNPQVIPGADVKDVWESWKMK